MERIVYFRAYNGTEIIDATSEAENRIAAMDYLERKYQRQQQLIEEQKHKLKNPLWKLISWFGMKGDFRSDKNRI